MRKRQEILPLAALSLAAALAVLLAAIPPAGACATDAGVYVQGWVSGLFRKVWGIAAFSGACFAAWGALWAVHAAMFRGTSAYEYGGIIGSDPLAMWAMFADRRGVGSVVPAVGLMVVAPAFALFRRGIAARRAAMALAVVAATLHCCCSTPAALGGACMNGRYFQPVIPVLLPFTALALAQAGRAGRRWMLFLLLLPVLYFAFLTPFIRRGVHLVYAPAAVHGFLNFSLLWEPFPSFYGDASAGALMAGTAFAASLFAMSALACMRGGGRLRGAVWAALAVCAFFSGRVADRLEPPPRLRPFDVLMEERHFRDFRVLGGTPPGYFEAFRGTREGPQDSICVLTDDQNRSHAGVYRLLHPADLPLDDWRGRPLRWGKVHHALIDTNGAGGHLACRATGRVVRGTARLALQIGGEPDAVDVVLPEGPFDVTFVARVARGNGGANFRLALENDAGEAVVETTEFVPWSEGLEKALGPLPGSTVRVDGTPPGNGEEKNKENT